jgi:hypothetical protein
MASGPRTPQSRGALGGRRCRTQRAQADQRVIYQRAALLTATRQAELLLDPVRGRFDIDHLREVQRCIFQGLLHHGPGDLRPDAPSHLKTRMLKASRDRAVVPYALRANRSAAWPDLGRVAGWDGAARVRPARKWRKDCPDLRRRRLFPPVFARAKAACCAPSPSRWHGETAIVSIGVRPT